MTNHGIDSASITESRRARRTKSDRLDATALVRLLLRHHAGERGVWSVVHVPSVDEEDRRHLHRELFTLPSLVLGPERGIDSLAAPTRIEVDPRAIGLV